MSLKQKLLNYRLQNGLTTIVRVSDEEYERYCELIKEEEPLPEGIYQDEFDYSFYRYSKTDELSKNELLELILHLQLKSINTIKKCLIFFVVLTSIGLVCGFLALILILGAI